MKMIKSAHWFLLGIGALAMACQPVDETGDEELGMAVDETEQSLLGNLDKGSIAFRQTKTGTLTNGDLTHFYKFTATAGQTVNFAVDWALPASNGLGAVIQVKNSTGSTMLAEHATLSSNQAHLVYTFATAGTYRIYVKQYGYALFGSYPYKVGAEPDLCAIWEGTYDIEEGVVRFFVANNFPTYYTDEPWNWDAGWGDDHTITSHSVVFGTCNTLIKTNCGTNGPAVFEVWFPTGTIELAPNACVMRNHVYETAGVDEGWGLWWDYCTAYPEACQL